MTKRFSGKYCQRADCKAEIYSGLKNALWALPVSGLIVIPKIYDTLAHMSNDDVFNIFNILTLSTIFWFGVWAITIGIMYHEKINNFLSLVVQSLSVPATVQVLAGAASL